MATKRFCLACGRRYTRSKGRHWGRYFCSDRCMWKNWEIPVDVIYERDDGICHLCGNHVPRNEASRDHIKPRSQGGRSKFRNFALAHASCNSRRGSKPVAEFRAILERQLASGKDTQPASVS